MTTNAGRPPTLIVKVASNGDIYMDMATEAASLDALVSAVDAVKADGGTVNYYREAPRSEPTEAANDVFRALMDTRVAIRLGHQAPSEWGTLDWVEVEESPHRSRFFLARGQRFLIARADTPGGEPVTYVGGPLSEEDENRWFGQMDILIRSDRVMETPPHEPEQSFATTAMDRPALHLRLGYGAERRWASYYPIEDLPGHIRSFSSDLSRVGHHMVASTEKGGWKELGAAEAEQLF
jgi:hypothetical protein